MTEHRAPAVDPLPVTAPASGRVGHLAWRTGGPRPRVVLLHGFTDAGCCWDPWLHRFAAPAMTIDARGHGESDLPDGPISPAIQAADVAMVLDQLGRDGMVDLDGGVIVVGHSMGASTAATLAHDRPDLVRAVVLGDPPAMARPAVDSRDPAGWLGRAREGSEADAVAASRAAQPGWPEGEHEPWVRSKRQLDLAVFDRPHPATPALSEVLSTVACPVLLLHGDPKRGGLVTPELARECAAARPAGNVEHRQLPEAGHNLRRDDPTHYAEIVLPWVMARLA